MIGGCLAFRGLLTLHLFELNRAVYKFRYSVLRYYVISKCNTILHEGFGTYYGNIMENDRLGYLWKANFKSTILEIMKSNLDCHKKSLQYTYTTTHFRTNDMYFFDWVCYGDFLDVSSQSCHTIQDWLELLHLTRLVFPVGYPISLYWRKFHICHFSVPQQIVVVKLRLSS